jgi:cell wall-associated NlpC family hydrolase
MKKILIITVMMLLGLVSSAQKQSENGFTDIITPDTTLNNFMMYWLRKPYKLGGSTEKGIDCSQFAKRLYKDVYSKELENVCYKQWNQTTRVKQDSLITGDLVFFRSKSSPSGWHCGVFIGYTYFIHAANKYEGVKISSLNEPRYMKSIRGFGRLQLK